MTAEQAAKLWELLGIAFLAQQISVALHPIHIGMIINGKTGKQMTPAEAHAACVQSDEDLRVYIDTLVTSTVAP